MLNAILKCDLHAHTSSLRKQQFIVLSFNCNRMQGPLQDIHGVHRTIQKLIILFIFVKSRWEADAFGVRSEWALVRIIQTNWLLIWIRVCCFFSQILFQAESLFIMGTALDIIFIELRDMELCLQCGRFLIIVTSYRHTATRHSQAKTQIFEMFSLLLFRISVVLFCTDQNNRVTLQIEMASIFGWSQF